MPPTRRSLRDRNRTAIEQPYQADDDAHSRIGHEPAPTLAQPTRGDSTDASTQQVGERRGEETSPPPSPRTADKPGRTNEVTTPAVVDQTSATLSDTGSRRPSTSPSSSPSDRPSSNGRVRRPGARKGRDGAAQAAREGNTSIPVARILYLPEDLIEPLRIYRATHAMTNTQVALRALNATYRQIPDLIAHETRGQIIVGDLFDEVIPTPTRSNRQVEITPTAAQLDTIDPLVESTGANDRSHLFAIAIRRFLTDAGLIQP